MKVENYQVIDYGDELTINSKDFNSLLQVLTSIYGRPPTLTEMGKVLQAISGVLDELEADDEQGDINDATTD